MNFRLPHIFFFLLALYINISAQGLFFEVISIDGTGKVQRSQKRDWEKIIVGTKLYDNDLVESYFQTKMIMRFGENNIVILGSNSKALLNIVTKEDKRGQISNVNLTLFGGGLFAKAISMCHISFYSANAVGEMDSGSVSIVADAKSGETGFQVLGGSVFIRNIAQQKGTTLRAGLTTMILPNKEPTTPLYLTHRHAAVLRHFFGEDYINSEFEASGIQPTDEQGTGNRLTLSQNLSKKSSSNTDLGTYKSLFNPNKVYGSLLKDSDTSVLGHKPIVKPLNPFPNKACLEFNSDIGISSRGAMPSFSLTPSINYLKLGVSLQITMARNSLSAMNSGFTSLAAILDKIQYLRIGSYSDSLYFYFGKIENYSMGYGLIVDHFSNRNHNQIFNSPGIKGQFQIADKIDLKLFLGNITTPYYGGVYLGFQPSVYNLGLGYYFDFNQYEATFDSDNFRFINYKEPKSYFPDPKDYPSGSHIYEFDFSTQVISNYDFQMNMIAEFAQKLNNGNDGIVARIPTITCDIDKMSFAAGLIVESQRLISSHFSPFYLSNRYRLKLTSNGLYEDTVFTQNNYLSKKRRSTGLALTFKYNPVKGLDIDAYYKQDILSKNTHHRFYSHLESTNTDSTISTRGDFTLLLNCRINDTLVPFFKYADIYYHQYHSTLYPKTGTFFSSWGMETGFNLITRPILDRLSFEAGGKLLYIDGNNNNSIDGDELIFDFYIGAQWGFL